SIYNLFYLDNKFNNSDSSTIKFADYETSTTTQDRLFKIITYNNSIMKDVTELLPKNTVITLPTPVVKVGYVASTLTINGTNYNVGSNYTLNEIYPIRVNTSAIQYQISYFDEDIQLTLNPSTYTVTQEVTLPTPIKEGYQCLGWYDNPSFDGSPITKIMTGST